MRAAYLSDDDLGNRESVQSFARYMNSQDQTTQDEEIGKIFDDVLGDSQCISNLRQC